MPGALVSRISPPSSLESSRLMARPRPVPPYLRLVLPSACWNASKMICCLSVEMPMPVSVTVKAITRSAWFSSSSFGRPAGDGRGDRQRHPAGLGELEGIREQVLDDLLQALHVGVHRSAADPGRARCGTPRPWNRRCAGTCAPRSGCSSARRSSLDVDRDGSRLDLREIEDVGDQREQIVARRVDGLRELDLLRRSGCGRRCAKAGRTGSAGC